MCITQLANSSMATKSNGHDNTDTCNAATIEDFNTQPITRNTQATQEAFPASVPLIKNHLNEKKHLPDYKRHSGIAKWYTTYLTCWQTYSRQALRMA